MNRASNTTKAALLVFMLCIIGALFFGLTQARVYSRDNKRVSDLKQISHALALYLDGQGRYPSGCEWSTDSCWKEFLKEHIRTPEDPLNQRRGDCEASLCYVYRYCRLSSATFVISTNLEKPKKRSVQKHPDCPLAGPNPYWVTN